MGILRGKRTEAEETEGMGDLDNILNQINGHIYLQIQSFVLFIFKTCFDKLGEILPPIQKYYHAKVPIFVYLGEHIG